MRLLFYFLLLLCSATTLSAQNCATPSAQKDLSGNNIKARILNGGDLFTNLTQFEGAFTPNSSGGASTMFSAGIWLAGLDAGGNLKLARSDFRPNDKTDYWAGPLDPNGVSTAGDCANWDRLFNVKGSEVADFLVNLPVLASDPATAIAQFPAIMGWPGRGNPHFSAVNGFDLPDQDLAPFEDADGNGVYNPLAGDYPVVALQGIPNFVPAEQIWAVFNDNGVGQAHISGGQPIIAEVHLTAWVFNCQDHPVLNNTVFTNHKVINRSVERLDNVRLGIWADFDIGCPFDDFIGCNPAQNTFYCYNADVMDGHVNNDCGNVNVFQGAAPVQSATLLNRSLNSFIGYYGNTTTIPVPQTDPGAPIEAYSYMNGFWRDNSPLSYGGSGYDPNGTPTSFAFPSDPADPNGWSMCAFSAPPGDQRSLGTTNIDSLLPGHIVSLVTAWTVHENPALPCGLGSTFADVAEVQALYNNQFGGVCSPLTTAPTTPLATAPTTPPDTLEVFPNPTAAAFTFQYGNTLARELRIFTAEGRWVRTVANLPAERVNVTISDLPAGIYQLQLVTDAGNFTRKLSLVK